MDQISMYYENSINLYRRIEILSVNLNVNQTQVFQTENEDLFASPGNQKR